jgi:hypothetical protein
MTTGSQAVMIASYHPWNTMSKTPKNQDRQFKCTIYALIDKRVLFKVLHRGRSNAMLEVEARPYREGAFLLVMKQATVAEAHVAKRTIKLLTMENLIPALTAFYGSIDQLKHQAFISTWKQPFAARDSASKSRRSCRGVSSEQNGVSYLLLAISSRNEKS